MAVRPIKLDLAVFKRECLIDDLDVGKSKRPRGIFDVSSEFWLRFKRIDRAGRTDGLRQPVRVCTAVGPNVENGLTGGNLLSNKGEFMTILPQPITPKPMQGMQTFGEFHP